MYHHIVNKSVYSDMFASIFRMELRNTYLMDHLYMQAVWGLPCTIMLVSKSDKGS